MAIGLIGRKAGMTRVFLEDGVAVPDRHRSRGRTASRRSRAGNRWLPRPAGDDGRASRHARDQGGCRSLRKGRLRSRSRSAGVPSAEGEGADVSVGAQLTVDMFTAGQKVDVTGTTIGRASPAASSGTIPPPAQQPRQLGLAPRAGLIGQNQTRVACSRPKRMAGHMGAVRRCTLNLEVVRVDAERNLLLVKGAMPLGSKGGDVDRASVRQGARLRGHHGTRSSRP